MIEHLQTLGVTAVELMPVHEFITDHHLEQRGGLANYWGGYNTIAFLAPPHHAYAMSGSRPGSQVQEFKAMVRDLHEAGIEVILDVVYNHTAEGSDMGPMLSMRGIDNRAYYRLVEDDQRYYMDYTGTGNSLNVRNPHTLQLIMDSLRYWVTEMHVDGFRFDLASTLAREFYDVDRLSVFFDLVQQDPVISQVKLIAEPWDVGPRRLPGRQLPAAVDGVERQVPRHRPRLLARRAGHPRRVRVATHRQLRPVQGRRPQALRVDQLRHRARRFTIADLVSYNDKHNDANGEGGNDGESHNRSWNCGVEGPTDDEDVLVLRARQQRNFITTLLLSQGVPMLLHGDELGRTQGGNNNVYCQDNEIAWMDWSLASKNAADRVHRWGGGRAAPRTPGVPAPTLLRGPPDPATSPLGDRRHPDGAARHRVVLPVRRGDDRAGLGLRVRQVRTGLPQRRGHHRGRPPRRACHRRLVPAVAQRALGGHRGDVARGRVRHALGGRRRLGDR